MHFSNWTEFTSMDKQSSFYQIVCKSYCESKHPITPKYFPELWKKLAPIVIYKITTFESKKNNNNPPNKTSQLINMDIINLIKNIKLPCKEPLSNCDTCKSKCTLTNLSSDPLFSQFFDQFKDYDFDS